MFLCDSQKNFQFLALPFTVSHFWEFWSGPNFVFDCSVTRPKQFFPLILSKLTEFKVGQILKHLLQFQLCFPVKP